jgi:hypothetical protein
MQGKLVKLQKTLFNLNYIPEQKHEEDTLFCTAHKHTIKRTYVCVCVFIEKRTLGCYAGNHIIKVKTGNKVAWGFPIQ